MLLRAIAGKGIFYYVSIASILFVLSLSANTAFADFPRLCRMIALDSYLPQSFTTVGRRLVYSNGIFVLAFLTGCLLILFGGVTDRLIPLYAIGAFLAFTLSQAGMVRHWLANNTPRVGHGRRFAIVNGIGAVATAVTTVVVLTAKFMEGAWVIVLLIPLMLLLMTRIRRHYDRVAAETAIQAPADFRNLQNPIVVVPIVSWDKLAENALRFAYTLSHEIRAVHNCAADDRIKTAFRENWERDAAGPAREAGLPPPELVVLDSPYRSILQPILDYILTVEHENPDRQIAVLLPEMVERHWYEGLLHNQRAELLKTWLLHKGNQRIVLVSVPWFLKV
jgi:hypothetical protein